MVFHADTTAAQDSNTPKQEAMLTHSKESQESTIEENTQHYQTDEQELENRNLNVQSDTVVNND